MILKKWSSWMSSTSTTGPSGWISTCCSGRWALCLTGKGQNELYPFWWIWFYRHPSHSFAAEGVRQTGGVIYDLDLVMPGEEGVVPGVVEKNDGVQYIRLDVRKPIDFEFVPTPEDVIFDLAAVHRTPATRKKPILKQISGVRKM